jgi:molybdopterin molybdotransferase
MASSLIELDEARRIVLESARPLASERVNLRGALDRVLAEDVIGKDPVPAFDNSAMDGFALRADDVQAAVRPTPAMLRVVGESRAGRPAGTAVGPGEAVSISTGAMLPDGADAVVPLEEAAMHDGAVAVFTPTHAGAYVRRVGEDVTAGQMVLARGTSLGPAELGLLASLGNERVQCTRRPRVALITTGDELLAPGRALGPGAVHDASAYTIPALARRAGGEVIDVSWAPDDVDAIEAAVMRALSLDVVVVCGGVSVGEHDHLKAALTALEVEERFWGVALKPGKPTWFGVRERTLVFGLPGNPVSAIVTFILLVAPALRALGGASNAAARTTARLAAECAQIRGRAHAVRCTLCLRESGWEVTPTGPQGSHILSSMLGAQALAIIPAGSGRLSAGSEVPIELLAPLAGPSP